MSNWRHGLVLLIVLLTLQDQKPFIDGLPIQTSSTVVELQDRHVQAALRGQHRPRRRHQRQLKGAMRSKPRKGHKSSSSAVESDAAKSSTDTADSSVDTDGEARTKAITSDPEQWPRASLLDTTDLICEIDWQNENQNTVVEETLIEYYVAVGSATQLNAVERHVLQQKLFGAVEQQIPWCYTEDSNERRNLRRTSDEQRSFQDDHGRRLEILSVSAGSLADDIGPCPDTYVLRGLIQGYEAQSCRIMRGQVRVRADEGDNLDFMTAVLLDTMEVKLNGSLIWADWVNQIPIISFVWYAGDTLDQVLDST